MAQYTYDNADELAEIIAKIEALERFARFPPNETDVPPGVIATLPTGGGLDGSWILCDGRAVNRVAFPRLSALYAADGYPFGNGDGSTTFNVPDLRGRMILALASSGTGSTFGGTGGAWNHTHGAPSHDHGSDGGHALGSAGSAHTHAAVSHSHGAGGAHSESQEGHSHSQGSTTNQTGGDHAHFIGLNASPSTHSHTTSQSTSFVREALRGSGSTAFMARQPHAHNLLSGQHPHAHIAAQPDSVSHSHTNPNTSVQNHTHGAANPATHDHGADDSHDHGSAGSSHTHGGSVGDHSHPSATPSIGTANPPVRVVTYWVKD